MKYNKEYTRNQIKELNKTKYMFLGFIVGIMPFVIIMSILSLKEGGIEFIPAILKETLLISGILTASINSFVLKNKILNKIETS